MDNTTKTYGQDQQKSGSSHHDTDLSQDLKNVKESINQTAQHAKEKAGDLLKDAQHKTADIQENVIEYVRVNPMKSVGIAVLVGLVAAILVRK